MPVTIGGFVPSNSFTVLSSAARTATPNDNEYQTSGHRFLTLVTDVTAIVTAPSITVSVLGVDRTSGKTYSILVGVAITAVGTQVLKIGPGLTAAANAVANDILPSTFRIVSTHGNSNSITYSIGAILA